MSPEFGTFDANQKAECGFLKHDRRSEPESDPWIAKVLFGLLLFLVVSEAVSSLARDDVRAPRRTISAAGAESLFSEMMELGRWGDERQRQVRGVADPLRPESAGEGGSHRRARKLARKKLQREGLLPMKPRVIPGAPRRGGRARPRF